jgi:hypothetical protein
MKALINQTAVLLTPIQQTILNCVRRQPGRFSRSGLAKLLAGSRTKRLGEMQVLPDYGRLAPYNRKMITGQIDVLLQQGWLELDGFANVILAENSSDSTIAGG